MTSVFSSSPIPSDFAMSSLSSTWAWSGSVYSYDSLISKRSSCTMARAASNLMSASSGDYFRNSSALSYSDMASKKSLRKLSWKVASSSSLEIIKEKFVIKPVSLMKCSRSLTMFKGTLSDAGFCSACSAYSFLSTSSQSFSKRAFDNLIVLL